MPGSTGARPTKDETLIKRSKAVTLRMAGATYDEIARTEHNGRPLYANRQNARVAVLRALEERHYEGIDQYRELQRARYERLVRTLYPRALGGDLDAMGELRRMMADLNRLLGLNMPTKIEVTDSMDAEIAALAAQLGEDGTWDITGIPEGEPPTHEQVEEEA
jgi:hypothetical protein